jgi:hypothetical protein
MFLLALLVLHIYVSRLEIDETWANVFVGFTLLVPGFFVSRYFVWDDREVELAASGRRWVVLRVLMSLPPHAAYLLLVGLLGLPYAVAKVGISVVWGACIALTLNYLLCSSWVLRSRGTEKA